MMGSNLQSDRTFPRSGGVEGVSSVVFVCGSEMLMRPLVLYPINTLSEGKERKKCRFHQLSVEAVSGQYGLRGVSIK